jgi:hypothetical protein
MTEYPHNSYLFLTLVLLLENFAGLWSRPSLLIQVRHDLQADKLDR